ncbi:MAG: ABC transporter permease [Planctomycetota bacterium]
MNVWRMIAREIAHRKGGFLLVLLGVATAVACVVGSLMLLKRHDTETEATLAQKEQETKKRLDELQEEYRKVVLQLGFNVFIVPKDAPPVEMMTQDSEKWEMPEDYAQKLAGAGVITINHILPSLTKPVLWPEKQAQILLTGIRGEITQAGMKRKEPLMKTVEPGQIVLGFSLAKQIGAKPGDKLKLLGEEFQVGRVHAFRGTRDDVTAWIDLAAAQRLLEKPGKITAIQAINCLAEHCHPSESGIPAVDEEIAKVLPDTKVLIDMGKAVTRIDVRKRAHEESLNALAAEKAGRAKIRSQVAGLAGLLGPLAVLGGSIWVGLVMLVNARQRRNEIGILRAIGTRARTIYTMFLGKALIAGVAGAILGWVVGVAAATVVGAFVLRAAGIAAAENVAQFTARDLVDQNLLLGVLLGAPLLAMVASWLPALLAAQEDPAAVLRSE